MTRSLPLLVLIAALSTGQQPAFRSGVEGVILDVAVFDRNRPVEGLTLSDFDIRDNGVPQTILDVTRGSLPITLDLLVDLSASSYGGLPLHWSAGPASEWLTVFGATDSGYLGTSGAPLRSALDQVRLALRPKDQLNVLTFGTNVRRVDAAVDARQPTVQELQTLQRRTAFLDAVTTALMQPSEPTRRRVIVAVGDTRDTVSVVSADLRLAVADRSDAVLYIVAVGGREKKFAVRSAPMTSGPVWNDGYDTAIVELAARTGGELIRVPAGEEFGRSLSQVIDRQRLRYLVSYKPSGVNSDGWHALSVRVKGRNYQIHARRGYWRNP
jgi:hypothetical protein